MLSLESAGMGAPGLEDERFADVVADASRRIGSGKKSQDARAIVSACFRAIGVPDQLGKRSKQREWRSRNREQRKPTASESVTRSQARASHVPGRQLGQDKGRSDAAPGGQAPRPRKNKS
jgi:hypothetical protein